MPSLALACRDQRGVVDPEAEILASPLLLLVYNTLFFGVFGCWVDFFYQLQAMVFGKGTGIGIVLIKMFIDQFVFTPTLHIPVIQMALLFGKSSCSCSQFIATIQHRSMLTCHGLLADWWFPALLPTWLVWVPSVCIVYGLPDSLQVVVFSIIMCFWSMIQMVLAGGDTSPDGTDLDNN